MSQAQDNEADDHNLADNNADDDDEEAADRARRLATMISTRTRILKCPLPARGWPRMPKSCRCSSTPCRWGVCPTSAGAGRRSRLGGKLARERNRGGNRNNALRWAAHWSSSDKHPEKNITENCSGTFSCSKSASSFSAAAERQGRWGGSGDGAGASSLAAAAATATVRTKRAVAGGGERTAAAT